MVVQLQLEDPTVNVEDIERFKLAFLMQFFVQHKQRFRFPRLRLQDLYLQVLTEPDGTAVCDCVARILRLLRHDDPSVSISCVEKALAAFVGEKRTTNRLAVQAIISAGSSVGQLEAGARAKLLEHLIESVYDELPDLSFNAPASSDSADDENVLIKAGQDVNGCSYYYMDDLRLYRQSPQTGLSSYWSVAVGPSTSQWRTFIASLSPMVREEAELGFFLQQDLYSLVQESLDGQEELLSDNPDLFPAALLAREASDIAEIRRRRGIPNEEDAKGEQSVEEEQPSQQVVCVASQQSSRSNSTSTCPLTPPTAQPPQLSDHRLSSAQASPLPSSVITKREPSTAPNTPLAQPNAWTPEGNSSLGSRYQHPNSVDTPCQTNSPLINIPQGTKQHQEEAKSPSCPLRPRGGQDWRPCSAGGGPLLAPSTSSLPQHPLSAPPFSSASCMTAVCGDPGGGYQSPFPATTSIPRKSSNTQIKVEPGCETAGELATLPVGIASPETAPFCKPSVMMQQSTPSTQMNLGACRGQPLLMGGASLVFTSILANEAAQEYARSQMRISVFHQMHPDVLDYLSSMAANQNGSASEKFPNSVNPGDHQPTALTQEQWENRKIKIAQLEKIHSTLTKSKSASTPGVATVAALQQQQQQHLYNHPNTAGTGGGPPSLSSGVQPVQVQNPMQQQLVQQQQQQQQSGINSMQQTQPLAPRAMRQDNAEAKREFDRLWMDHQRKRETGQLQQQQSSNPQQQPPLCLQPMFVDATRPQFSQDPCLIGGGGAPPVLVVPPNNACEYPPAPGTRFMPPASAYSKRPYPGVKSDIYDTPPEFWGPPDMMDMIGGFSAPQTTPASVTTTSGSRPSRSGLSKKRKSAAAANRAAAVAAAVNSSAAAASSQMMGCNTMTVSSSGRVGVPPPMYAAAMPPQRIMAGGKQMMEQHRQQQQTSFGSIPMGQHPQQRVPYPMPTDQSGYPMHMPGSGGGGFRSGGHMGEMAGGGGYLGSPIPTSTTPVSLPSDGVVLGAPSSAPPLSSSSSTQHLTSASLASLARLSQLSGSEGPFLCGGPPGFQQRMVSAPDLQGLFSDDGGPPQGPPVSGMYPISNSASYLSLPPGHYQHPQQQLASPSLMGHLPPGLSPSSSLLPSSTVSTVPLMTRSHSDVSAGNIFVGGGGHLQPSSQPQESRVGRSLTPSGPHHTVTSAPLPPSQMPTPLSPVSTASQSMSQPLTHPPTNLLPPPHQHPPPSIQVNNTFFNAQLNVQQMNYQHVNGTNSNSQMQIHFVQQQQQQQNIRPPSVPSQPPPGCYASGPPSAPQKNSTPAPTTANTATGSGASVQITPKTPHTIQYLPASGTQPPQPIYQTDSGRFVNQSQMKQQQPPPTNGKMRKMQSQSQPPLEQMIGGDFMPHENVGFMQQQTRVSRQRPGVKQDQPINTMIMGCPNPTEMTSADCLYGVKLGFPLQMDADLQVMGGAGVGDYSNYQQQQRPMPSYHGDPASNAHFYSTVGQQQQRVEMSTSSTSSMFMQQQQQQHEQQVGGYQQQLQVDQRGWVGGPEFYGGPNSQQQHISTGNGNVMMMMSSSSAALATMNTNQPHQQQYYAQQPQPPQHGNQIQQPIPVMSSSRIYPTLM